MLLLHYTEGKSHLAIYVSCHPISISLILSSTKPPSPFFPFPFLLYVI